ncbi:hypothetical protein AKG98_3800 [Moritella sp. JT01]|uniref:hypothetical protein n=1 Tax=Moritella sp. JT01 TaxID=756698 RepID=UPI0007985FDF|nr:hypothetical protein [Moritella sp. JT01]KXO12605.1 hypothetical protein AKG98_3800 [Moritella sp. JT01]
MKSLKIITLTTLMGFACLSGNAFADDDVDLRLRKLEAAVFNKSFEIESSVVFTKACSIDECGCTSDVPAGTEAIVDGIISPFYTYSVWLPYSDEWEECTSVPFSAIKMDEAENEEEEM